MKKKLLLIIAIVLIAVIAGGNIIISSLGSSSDVIKYDNNNITVSMVDGDLICYVKGTDMNYVSTHNISVGNDGKDEEYIFLQLAASKWNDITVGDDEVVELCIYDHNEEGASNISRVYYFTGELSELNFEDTDDIQKYIDKSILLYEK